MITHSLDLRYAVSLIVASGLLFSSNVASAAPAIQNATLSSNVLTISGSGFGTKVTAKPLVFDNFNAGTSGKDIVGQKPTITTLNSGSWIWGGTAAGGSATPKYTTGNQRTGSTVSAVADMNGAQWNNSLTVYSQQSEYYASWWMYYDHYAGSISRNTKPWVFYGSSNDEPHAYSGWGDMSDSMLRSAIADSNYSDSKTAYGSPGTPDFYGKWMKFEIYLKQSSPGTANGAYKVWITEPGKPRVLQLNRDPVQTRGTSNSYSQFTFVGAYCDSSPADRKYRIYADDFYFDNTQARVELGNASTYANSTITEVQPATSWSASGISVSLNQGALPTGSTAYIYVIDAAGSVNSSGYPVIVGSSSASTGPLTPASNLR